MACMMVKIVADCIRTENSYRSISGKELKSTYHSDNGKSPNDLMDVEIEEICESLRPYYHKGSNSRNDIVFCGDNGQKIDYVTLLTDQLMGEYTFKTFKDTEEILYYDTNKGVYVQGGEWLIKEQCEILCPQIQTSKVLEVVNHIKRRTGVERSRFDSNLDILNLQNGLLNIETGEFREHSPDYLSVVQLPIAFDPNAKCPKILKFLGQVLHPQDVFKAMQIIGYCLYRNN